MPKAPIKTMQDRHWIYELVKLADLKTGAPFYRENPLENNHNGLPDYNTPDSNYDPETQVWTCYSASWRKNIYTK
jgi:hypothetical protein